MGGLVQPESCDQALPRFAHLVQHAQHRQIQQYACWSMIHTERYTALLIFGINMCLHVWEVIGCKKS